MIESPGLVGLEQRRTKAASRSATKSLLRAHAERIALAHWTGPYDPIPQEALQVELAETSRYIGVKHANLSEATVKAWCALDGDAIRAEQLTEGHNMPNESKTVVRTTPVTAGPSRHVRTNLEKRQAQQPAPEPPKGNGAPP